MRQIIAMGHGGFSMSPDNLVLDAYICEQTGKTRPKVCFLPQASGEARDYIINFYKAFTELDTEPSHLSLFQLPTEDLEDYVMAKDVIYVGGGNTKSMLSLWREWNLDVILRKAWENGTVLAGLSAGAICWFESMTTDSVPGALTTLGGLGYLKGSCVPHYDAEATRRPSYHTLVTDGALPSGYGIDEGAAAHFIGNDLLTVVTSLPEVSAYYVSLGDDGIVEDKLPATYLEPR